MPPPSKSVQTETAPTSPRATVSVREVSKLFRVGKAESNTLKDLLLARSRRSKPNFAALSDVSFDVYEGETFGILGHNGSGKSTLLKLISGIMQPTSGDIEVRGRLAALLELGAGFHPDLTGAENIFLNGSVLGLDRAYVEQTYDEIVAFAELEDFIDMQVRHYSSGMRARLGFSVATHLEPDVLLVDEILSVGDETFQQKCLERVHRFRSMGRTMLLVNHSAERIRQLCSRAAVLDRGELIFVGDADEAIVAYRRALAARRGDGGTRPAPQGAAASEEAAGELTPPVAVVATLVGSENPDDEFPPGSDIAVVVTLDVHERVPFRVRVVVRNQEGVVLFNRASLGLLGGPIEVDPGNHRVAFTLKNVPLRDGTYVVDTLAESPDGKELFDRMGQAGTFTIKGSGIGLGLVVIRASCTLAEEGDLTPTAELATSVKRQPKPRKAAANA